MLLVVAATELEINRAARILTADKGWMKLVSGVGCLETAANMSRFLSGPQGAAVLAVINFGVAGAFRNTGVNPLDICLAESDVLADLGVCHGDEVRPLAELAAPDNSPMDRQLLSRAKAALVKACIPFHCGPFVSVNSVSGTAARGNFLRNRFQAICENMEGAAVARICRDFALPCLELRCVSNMVEDRDLSRWRLAEAVAKGAEALAAVIRKDNEQLPMNLDDLVKSRVTLLDG